MLSKFLYPRVTEIHKMYSLTWHLVLLEHGLVGHCHLVFGGWFFFSFHVQTVLNGKIKFNVDFSRSYYKHFNHFFFVCVRPCVCDSETGEMLTQVYTPSVFPLNSSLEIDTDISMKEFPHLCHSANCSSASEPHVSLSCDKAPITVLFICYQINCRWEQVLH